MIKFKTLFSRPRGKTGTNASAAEKSTNVREKEELHQSQKTKGKKSVKTFKAFPQPKFTRFENLNPFEPESHTVLYCMNKLDNIPQKMRLEGSEFIYYISQSRSPGHKDYGQDCMGTAKQGNWETHILCDGHDRQGHFVALGVCQVLPRVVLRMLSEKEKEDPSITTDIPEDLLLEAFNETAKTVCWTMEGISVGMWVDVFEGQWAGKPGYIKENATKSKVRVAIIDQNGYHLPTIDRSSLRRPRYTGGCTCLCFVRNIETGVCKVATSGDSRLMVYPSVASSDPIFGELNAVSSEIDKEVIGNITPSHNVYNLLEKERLDLGFSGQYEFDGNFLVNPVTKFAIQPTRGFGDFDMHGTGYTHVPEVTKSFKLTPDTVILASSDGVFDEHVWQDEEVLEAVALLAHKGMSASQIADHMYTETLARSLEGGYVDDISIWCYKHPAQAFEDIRSPSVQELRLTRTDEDKLKNVKKTKKKKDTKEKRRTMARGDESFTQARAQASQQALGETLNDDIKASEIDAEAANKIMRNLAASKGYTNIDMDNPVDDDDDSVPEAL